MADPVSIGEDLVKLIKELKNRSDQVSSLSTLPKILSMTSSTTVVEGKSERALLDHDRSHQLHHSTPGVATRLWRWTRTGIWRDLASHNLVSRSHHTVLLNILIAFHFQVNYLASVTLANVLYWRRTTDLSRKQSGGSNICGMRTTRRRRSSHSMIESAGLINVSAYGIFLNNEIIH